MIELKVGDIFAENAEALVNSVNCVGVMGRGIALQFKNRFPENFQAYSRACRLNEVRPGNMFVYETGLTNNPRFIINFPTKRHWRGKSRIGDIEAGLESLVKEIRERGIKSVAIPPLGSDLGGLDWNDVYPRIESALQDLGNVVVVIFQPGSGPADGRPNFSTSVPNMTATRASLIALINRYLDGQLDPFVSLLEIHKLMYFLQMAGEPLRLNYQKAHYGPYAENLRHMLRDIEGHFISGYRDGGDQPDKPLSLVPGAIEDAYHFLEDEPRTMQHLGEVADLVQGFESPYGLELLATVHWIASQDPSISEENLVGEVYAWGSQKRQFSERHIGLSLEVLRKKGWLTN